LPSTISSRKLQRDTCLHYLHGSTWITPAWQRSAIHIEATDLQLRHAFETWGCIRVEFQTDSLHTRSRQALARIGATEESTFRNHMVMPDGRRRPRVYFRMTNDAWARVKAHLEGLLVAYPTTSAAPVTAVESTSPEESRRGT
jgi:hypothetical protein